MPVPEIQIESIKTILNGKADASSLPYLSEREPGKVADRSLKGSEGFWVTIKKEKEKFVISIGLLHWSFAKISASGNRREKRWINPRIEKKKSKFP